MIVVKTDPAIEQAVCDLYRDGLTIVEVSGRLGISRSTAQLILKRRGVEARSRGSHGDADRDAKFLTAWEAARPSQKSRVALDFGYAHEESARSAANAILRGERGKEASVKRYARSK